MGKGTLSPSSFPGYFKIGGSCPVLDRNFEGKHHLIYYIHFLQFNTGNGLSGRSGHLGDSPLHISQKMLYTPTKESVDLENVSI